MSAQYHALDSKMSSERAAKAARLMSQFARRTGLASPGQDQQRYLWTDAFAVCNFLELFQRTGDPDHRRSATQLIDQVHQVLGRFRDDDVRRGWISALDDEIACRHPTAGGLRIGKSLKERAAHEPLDERREWDRDGQYFHYLTKWMHALCEAAFFTGESVYARWAVELANAAFQGFVRRAASGEVVGLAWKMSTDLSRPLVPATGLHDALDGFITFREVQNAVAKMQADVTLADLPAAIESLSVLCRHRNWTTDDPLGIGGLLFDACRLCQLPSEERLADVSLLDEIMDACSQGLIVFLANKALRQPQSYRLAFRELGLAIGLCALPIIADTIAKDESRFGSRPGLQGAVDMLLRYESVAEEIISFWFPHAQQQDKSWQAHQNINDVMLATALVPELFLSVGERVPRPAERRQDPPAG